jgi:hypothetical protein
MTQSFSLGISDLGATEDTVHQSSIVALFRRQAALRPFAPALEVNDRTLTYEALDAAQTVSRESSLSSGSSLMRSSEFASKEPKT